MNPKNNARSRIMNNIHLPSSGSNITELPADIMLEIFFKLSTEDLLCSMCVCRSWYNLISNPNFTSNYRRNSHFTTVVLSQIGSTFRNFFLLDIAPSGEVIQWPIKPKSPRPAQEKSFSLSVIGLLDGLLFILMSKLHDYGNKYAIKEEVYVCNPLFSGCFKLGNYIIVENYRPTRYILGFVSSTEKYKILRIVFREDGPEAHIFSVGEDDEWRRLEGPLSLLSGRTEDCYFNGAYHYFVEDENDVYIYTFDFGTEKGGPILKPPHLSEKYHRRRLATLGNRLCVVELSVYFEMITIWAMEEYGVSSSWTRTILLRRWFQSRYDFDQLMPVDILRNGDFLFLYGIRSMLVRFNCETKKCSEIKVRDRDFGSFPHEVTAYAGVNTPRFSSIRKNALQGQYGVGEMFG